MCGRGSPSWTRRFGTSPALAALPGRFWFSLDDGRGDVSGLRADAGVQVLDDHTVALLLAGVDTGVRLSPDTARADAGHDRRPVPARSAKSTGG